MKDKLDKAFDDLLDVVEQRNLKNYVAIILDRSGSMQRMRREAVDLFNEQVDALQKSTGEMQTFISLVTFASVVDKLEIWCQPVADFPKLDYNDYNPSGGTALRDAIGTTIRKFERMDAFKDPNASFLVISITDGEENMSKKFSGSALAELIQTMQETKRWTFSYVGGDIDFSKISAETNIGIGSMASCSFSTGASISPGMGSGALGGGLSSYVSEGISNYMGNRARGMTSTDRLYDGLVSNSNVTLGIDITPYTITATADDEEAKKLRGE